jgi:hypothetical protein
MNYEKLVNATQCAKILTDELDRPIKRPYLSKLANENRIPYHIVNNQKLFNPLKVLNNLPNERLTSSKFKDNSTDVNYYIPSNKDLINHFKANGLKFSTIPILQEYPQFKDKIEDTTLPKIQLPTVKDIKKELSVLELSKEQQELINDEYIETFIQECNPSYVEFNTLFSSFMNIRIEQEYNEIFDTTVDIFSENQIAYIKYLLLSSFTNPLTIAELIADYSLNEIDNN